MMRKEIGSEFWHGSTKLDGNGIGELMPKGFDTKYVLSGRTALEIIVEDAITNFGISSAYLPGYCCHTMIEPFYEHGIIQRKPGTWKHPACRKPLRNQPALLRSS